MATPTPGASFSPQPLGGRGYGGSAGVPQGWQGCPGTAGVPRRHRASCSAAALLEGEVPKTQIWNKAPQTRIWKICGVALPQEVSCCCGGKHLEAPEPRRHNWRGPRPALPAGLCDSRGRKPGISLPQPCLRVLRGQILAPRHGVGREGE